MATTTNIGFNLLQAGGETGADIQMNENLELLDLIFPYPVLLDVCESNPANLHGATGPEENGVYYVKGTGAGDWTGHDRELAIYLRGAWHFLPTELAMFGYDPFLETMVYRTGGTDTWQEVG